MTADPNPTKPPEQPLAVPGDADQAPASLPAASPELRRALWTQASELIVDTGYNYRAHLIVGQKRREQAKFLGVPRVVLPVAASAGTAFLALIGFDKVGVVAFGFIGAIVVALEKYFDPIGQANAHSDKGDRLLTLYKDLRSFRNLRFAGPSPSTNSSVSTPPSSNAATSCVKRSPGNIRHGPTTRPRRRLPLDNRHISTTRSGRTHQLIFSELQRRREG